MQGENHGLRLRFRQPMLERQFVTVVHDGAIVQQRRYLRCERSALLLRGHRTAEGRTEQAEAERMAQKSLGAVERHRQTSSCWRPGMGFRRPWHGGSFTLAICARTMYRVTLCHIRGGRRWLARRLRRLPPTSSSACAAGPMPWY